MTTTTTQEMASAAIRHSLSPTPPAGLDQQEVIRRREAGLGNNVRTQTGRTYWQIFTMNTFTFMNTIFFVIGVVMVSLGLWSDAIISVGLVFMNMVISISQEFRAKRQLDKIALLTRPTASVIREGKEHVIDPSEIVLGDLLVVRAGDQIVVDGELVGEGKLEVDESLLTGESDLIIKTAGDSLLSGSFCVTGTATYIAQRVGKESYANKLTESARQFRMNKTPLQHDIDLLIRLLVLLAVIFGVLFGSSFILRQVSAVENVRAAAVIVGLIPNGLFFMVIAAYAMGALRMSGKGALIQQVNAVESMSNVDVLCLDKTGTLTANRITLEHIAPQGGHDPEMVRQLLATYAASVSSGNRTSEALHEGLNGEKRPVRDEVPFSSARKWSALVFDDSAYVLGAPDVLKSAFREGLGYDLTTFDEWTSQGLRVVLFGRYSEPVDLYNAEGQVVLPPGLEPLALVSFSDELRPEARETLESFAKAGIKLKIISGDDPATVQALARQAGFDEKDLRVVSGRDIDPLDDTQLMTVAETTTIFGRIRPDQKERIVSALKRRGHYVAMIGDGVNDVMSLKNAQVGIAMQSGSQATRGVADIVLMGDSFRALPWAFTEGQRILNGMQDVCKLFMTRAFYVALLIFGSAVVVEASLFPFLPVHGGLLTFLTVGFPTFALAAWAKPVAHRSRIVHTMLHFVIPAGISIACLGLFVYVFYLYQTPPVLEYQIDNRLLVDQILGVPRTALLVTLMLAGLVLIPFAEPPSPFWVGGDELSGDRRPTLLALGMLGIFVIINAVPPLRNFFQIELLSLLDYGFIVALVMVWALTLRFVWRMNLFNRLLGMEIRRYEVD